MKFSEMGKTDRQQPYRIDPPPPEKDWAELEDELKTLRTEYQFTRHALWWVGPTGKSRTKENPPH
jgi:hypothetical protein